MHLAASGAVLPEVLTAASELAGEEVVVHLVDVRNDRLYHAWRRGILRGVGSARVPALPAILGELFTRGAPVVTVRDASSHALAWLGSALGVTCVPIGVDDFGQSGSLADVYSAHDLNPGSIVNAALATLAINGHAQ